MITSMTSVVSTSPAGADGEDDERIALKSAEENDAVSQSGRMY